MESLAELLNSLSVIADVGSVIFAIVVIVWVVNKFLDKQQEQQLLYMEQNNKTIKTISNYTEAITRLVSLMEHNLQETKRLGEELEDFQSEVLQKIEQLDKEKTSVSKEAKE